ncbi:MAG: hypothetical protein R3332_10485 [Pseudohongiellaceae bacterium]|nr:hypothetical protein [Pseudohongiellaceae bacterium]
MLLWIGAGLALIPLVYVSVVHRGDKRKRRRLLELVQWRLFEEQER